MSITTDTTELKKMFEAAPIFKPAGEDALSLRKRQVYLDMVKGAIRKVKNKRTCGICHQALDAGITYLLVPTGGSFAGATVCDLCVRAAAKVMEGA